MRLLKFWAIPAVILVSFCCSQALSQTTVPSSRFRPLPAESPEATAPFTEPFAYNYDAQMFAPYDLRDLEEPCAPCGFYFTYDRVYWSVSRPGPKPFVDPGDVEFTPLGNDFMWGNRFEGGVMNADGSGWGGEYTRSSGSFFSSGQDVLVATPFLTTTAVHNVKLNRVFRQGLQRGGWLEPYFGFRYLGISDSTIEDSLVGGNPNRFKQTASNSAFGGHVGARHARKMGRWGVATDGALAMTYNSQRYFATDIQTIGAALAIFETNDENSEFAPALDLRADLSYALTRDLAFRLGTQILYVWDGVNRANTLPAIFNSNSAAGPGGPNGIFSEDFISAGFAFGIEWKR
jgi:hypothetical protein